ncbi:MAG: hypothetical protein OXC55_08250 [Chloroflexi bacterium]|nr:hypothetical protein [Chloroflexota bacterium]
MATPGSTKPFLPAVPPFSFPQLSGDPAEHSNEDIMRSAEAILNSYLAAQLALPEANLFAMSLTRIAACRGDIDDLAPIADGQRSILPSYLGASVKHYVNGVHRIDDVRAWISVTGYVDERKSNHLQTFSLLHQFEGGQWRSASCLQGPDGTFAVPDNIQESLRSYYIGEQVAIQSSRMFPSRIPFSVTVLNAPEFVTDTLLSLPVRYTAVTTRWTLNHPYAILGLAEDPQEVRYWSTTDCPGARNSKPVALVKGGWIDTRLCFEPANSEDIATISEVPWERPAAWLEFPLPWNSYVLARPAVIDLTKSVEPTEPVRFVRGLPTTPVVGQDPTLHRIRWAPNEDTEVSSAVTLSETSPSAAKDYRITVLGPLEIVDDSAVRVLIRIESFSWVALWINSRSLGLSGEADESGHLTNLGWWTFSESERFILLYPDQLRATELKRGETIESYVYFLTRDESPVTEDSLPTTLWVWDEIPVKLQNHDTR